MFTKGEMAGAGIEDHVHATTHQTSARPIGHPCVLANLEAEPDSTDVEIQVADRVTNTFYFNLPANALRPGLKPTWLVMNSLAGQETLVTIGAAPEVPISGPVGSGNEFKIAVRGEFAALAASRSLSEGTRAFTGVGIG